MLEGLVAGATGAVAVYPIDVIKTRMQNQTNNFYKNGFDCAKKLWQQGGIKPFYRGCLSQLIGVGPEKAIKLYAYNSVINNSPNEFKSHLLGGLLAGTCQVLITCPYEMIKINRQMNIKHTINIRNLYTGFIPCLLRDVPFSGIYFPTYWYLKEKLNYNPLIAGTIAGAPAAFLCTPADVIKTRMQTMRNNSINGSVSLGTVVGTIKNIYQEGLSAFFKGGGWRVLRSSPQFGITLLVFEKLNN